MQVLGLIQVSGRRNGPAEAPSEFPLHQEKVAALRQQTSPGVRRDSPPFTRHTSPGVWRRALFVSVRGRARTSGGGTIGPADHLPFLGAKTIVGDGGRYAGLEQQSHVEA